MKSITKLSLITAMIASSMAFTACSNSENETASVDDSAVAGEPESTAAAANDKLDTKFLTIATGGASGPYNIIGTSLSEVYVKTFGVNSKTQTTGASVENVNLLTQGKVDMVRTYAKPEIYCQPKA